MRFFIFISILLSSPFWILPLHAQTSRRSLSSNPAPLSTQLRYRSVQCEISRPEDRSLRVQQVRLPLTQRHRFRFEVQSGVRKIHPIIELLPEEESLDATLNARERAPSPRDEGRQATGSSTGSPLSFVGGISGILLTTDADETIALLTSKPSRSTSAPSSSEAPPSSEGSAIPPEAFSHFKLSPRTPQFEGRALLMRSPNLRQELRVRCALGEALGELPPLQLPPNPPVAPTAERVGPEVSRINRSPAIVPNPPLRLPKGTPTGLPDSTAGSATGTH